jgi:hypothetical protein
MQLFDRAFFDRSSVRKTEDGYLTAFARIARTGIQEYAGYEVGKPDVAVVRVYRPPEEVFHSDAMHSYAHRPVTLNHPKDAVTATNWKEFARGQTGSEVVRDGEFVRVPMVMMDSKLIKSVEDGDTVELSMGYSTELKWEKGLTTDGKEYDAIQTQIRGNHLAVVAAARGGSSLRVGDDNKETNTMEKDLKTITVDGITVQVLGDVSAKVIERHIAAMETKLASLAAAAEKDGEEKKQKDATLLDAQTKAKTEIETRDGKIVALEKQVKDAEVTPAKLDEMVKDRQVVIDAAKKIVPKITVDGKSLAEIRKATVEAKLGADAVKTMSDAAVEGAFSAITAGAAAAPARGNNVRESAVALGDTRTTTAADAKDAAWEDNNKRMENAWKKPVAAAAA